MLDPKDCEKIRTELESLSQLKIGVAKTGRDIVKISKQLIYAVHRGQLDAARGHLKKIEAEKAKLVEMAEYPRLKSYGPYKNALQEYVEAVAYLKVVDEGRLPSSEELGVDAETYMSGLSDLTGELLRGGVKHMIAKEYKEAAKTKDIVEEIYGFILSVDFDGGEARHKSDQVKYALAKLEDLIYDAKMRDKL